MPRRADATAGRPTGRSRRSPLHRNPPESALGRGFYLRPDMARVRIRGLCHRRVCRRIVGWRVSASMRTDIVRSKRSKSAAATVSSTWSITATVARITSMRYTGRLADAGIEPSVGSRGDSYDNALAGSVIGRFKTEVIQRKEPWRHLEAVEFATLEWVDWFNTRRLFEPMATCRPQSTKRGTISRPPLPDSHQPPSDTAGTIHSGTAPTIVRRIAPICVSGIAPTIVSRLAPTRVSPIAPTSVSLACTGTHQVRPWTVSG